MSQVHDNTFTTLYDTKLCWQVRSSCNVTRYLLTSVTLVCTVFGNIGRDIALVIKKTSTGEKELTPMALISCEKELTSMALISRLMQNNLQKSTE